MTVGITYGIIIVVVRQEECWVGGGGELVAEGGGLTSIRMQTAVLCLQKVIERDSILTTCRSTVTGSSMTPPIS